MTITEVKIRKTYSGGRLRALVSITIDHELAIHDIKVIEGSQRLFVAMPSRKEENGFRDIVHPINPETRVKLEELILSVYREYIETMEAEEGLMEDFSGGTAEDME